MKFRKKKNNKTYHAKQNKKAIKKIRIGSDIKIKYLRMKLYTKKSNKQMI